MIETLIIVTLCVVWLIFFRPGKTPPLESRLTIERPGRYQIVLAPKLNLAQPFIEAVAERIGGVDDAALCSETQCFAVRDKQVTAQDGDVYLLAISCRNGMFYFQATRPLSDNPGNYLETIRKFARDALESLPAGGKHSQEIDGRIIDAVNEVSQQHGTDASNLSG